MESKGILVIRVLKATEALLVPGALMGRGVPVVHEELRVMLG